MSHNPVKLLVPCVYGRREQQLAFVVLEHQVGVFDEDDGEYPEKMHFFDINRVFVKDNEIKFEKDLSTSMLVRFPSRDGFNRSLQCFVKQYYDVLFGWKDSQLCDFEISLPVMVSVDKTVPALGGFLQAYAAYCTFYDDYDEGGDDNDIIIPEDSEIFQEDETMDITPLIDGRNKRNKIGLRCRAFASALKTNLFFKKLIMRDCQSPEILGPIISALAENTVLNSLIMDHCMINIADLERFSSEMVISNISTIDFSNNSFGDKGARALSPFLLSHLVVSLKLANCGLTSTGVHDILDSLVDSSFASEKLEHLDLSFNDFHSKNGLVFRAFGTMFGTKKFESLQSLILMKCNMNLPVLLDILSTNSINIPRLAALHLADNDIPPPRRTGSKKKGEVFLASSDWESPADLGLMLSNLPQVKSLDLSNTGISSKMLLWLTEELFRQQRSEGVRSLIANPLSLSISSNPGTLNDDFPALFKALDFSGTVLISHLDISGNRVGKDVLMNLVKSLHDNPVVKFLNLGENYAHRETTAMSFGASLGTELCKIPSLETLYLGGDGGKEFYFGSGISALLGALRSAPSLKILSFPNNRAGELGALGLCGLISSQKSAICSYASIDRNNFTESSISAIVNALKKNYTVTSFAFPTIDADRHLRSRVRTSLETDVEETILRNIEWKKSEQAPPFKLVKNNSAKKEVI